LPPFANTPLTIISRAIRTNKILFMQYLLFLAAPIISGRL
jgi:hypothetical protein